MLVGTASNRDIAYIQNMIEAIQKFPVYNGRTYRNVMFQNEQDYNSFLEKNLQDEVVKLKAITSSSKRPNGYPLLGKYVVHIVIDGVSGRDIADTYGIPKQQEVLFLPGTQYKVNSVSVANDGHPIIYAKEIANDEVQIGNGDNGGRKSESTRNSGNDRIVSQGEGNDVGRVLLHDGGRTETAEKVRDSEIRNADVNQTEVKSAPTFTEIFENAAFDELISAMKEDGILHERGEIVKPDTVQYQSREYLEENENGRTREETRYEFLKRYDAEIYSVRERGQIGYGYSVASNVTQRAETTKREIEKYGIKVVDHNGVQK